MSFAKIDTEMERKRSKKLKKMRAELREKGRCERGKRRMEGRGRKCGERKKHRKRILRAQIY